MWRLTFHNVKMRAYRAVTGKRETCSLINQKRKIAKRKEQEGLTMLHQMHRGGLFKLERMEYKKRVEASRRPENRGRVMHFIMDAMDQSKLHVPNPGTQDQFSCTLGQVRQPLSMTIFVN